jgi:hypothetical protein
MYLAALLLGRSRRSSHLDTHRPGRTTSSICYQPILHSLGNTNKGRIDVNVILGGTLKKWNIEFPGQLFPLFCGDHLFVQHIALVSNQEFVDVDIRVLLDLADPVANALKGAAVRHVVDQQNALRATKVRGGDCSETLLAGRVPDLKLDLGAFDIHILDLKVNANRRDKGGTERVVGVTEQETSLTDSGVADHQQLDLNVIGGASRSHRAMLTG